MVRKRESTLSPPRGEFWIAKYIARGVCGAVRVGTRELTPSTGSKIYIVNCCHLCDVFSVAMALRTMSVAVALRTTPEEKYPVRTIVFLVYEWFVQAGRYQSGSTLQSLQSFILGTPTSLAPIKPLKSRVITQTKKCFSTAHHNRQIRSCPETRRTI